MFIVTANERLKENVISLMREGRKVSPDDNPKRPAFWPVVIQIWENSIVEHRNYYNNKRLEDVSSNS